MAVILDDREDVWHGEQHRHLLPIRPYRYFKHQKDKEGPIPEDACPQLNYSLEFLEKVHAGFYSEMAAQNTSAADIIETERQKVLHGCRCAFSSVFPMSTSVRETREAMWIVCLGGIIDGGVQDGTTHLIAKNPLTAKVREAAMRGIFIVSLDWLWFSIWHSSRANETTCALRGVPADIPRGVIAPNNTIVDAIPAVNLDATEPCLEAAIPAMRAAQAGHIIR